MEKRRCLSNLMENPVEGRLWHSFTSIPYHELMYNMTAVQQREDRERRVEQRAQENPWNYFCEILSSVHRFHLYDPDVIRRAGALKDIGQGRERHIP